MTITNMRVQNFKSWRDTGEMRLAPITGLFGTNSSGKSSLLQFLALLKQTTQSPDPSQVLNLNAKGALEFGTFLDILFKHDPNNTLRFRLDWKDEPDLRVKASDSSPLITPNHWERLGFVADIGWQVRKGNEPGNMFVQQFSYEFGEFAFGMRRRQGPSNGYEVSGGLPDAAVKPPRPPNESFPPPGRFYQFPDRVFLDYNIDMVGRLGPCLGLN